MFFKEEQITAIDRDVLALTKHLLHYGVDVDIHNIQDFSRNGMELSLPYTLDGSESPDEKRRRYTRYYEIAEEVDEVTAEILAYELKPEEIMDQAIKKFHPGTKKIIQKLTEMSQSINLEVPILFSLLTNNTFSETLSDELLVRANINIPDIKKKLELMISNISPNVCIKTTAVVSELVLTFISLSIAADYETYSQYTEKKKRNSITKLLTVSGTAIPRKNLIKLNCFDRYIINTSSLLNELVLLMEVFIQVRMPDVNIWNVIILHWFFVAFLTKNAIKTMGDLKTTRKHEVAHILQDRLKAKSGLLLFLERT